VLLPSQPGFNFLQGNQQSSATRGDLSVSSNYCLSVCLSVL